MKTFPFNQVQDAFINHDITLDQFIEVLVDNFGRKRTRKILEHNLEIAMKKEQCKADLQGDV